jgi:uncharacterized membrane protein YhhN
MLWLVLVGGVSVVALVWSEWRENRLRLAAKPTASLCFIAAALAAGAVDTGYGQWVLAGLVLSTIGDVALLWRSSKLFLVGLGSFLLGHVAYVGAFATRGVDSGAALVAAVLLVGPAFLVIRWLWPHVPSAMQQPVAAYAVVISLMVAMAIGTVVSDADGRILAAAVLFYFSDLAVARDRFVAPGAVNRVWGLPLYYLAQFVFAASVAT